jgi:hypothetical protein
LKPQKFNHYLSFKQYKRETVLLILIKYVHAIDLLVLVVCSWKSIKICWPFSPECWGLNINTSAIDRPADRNCGERLNQIYISFSIDFNSFGMISYFLIQSRLSYCWNHPNYWIIVKNPFSPRFASLIFPFIIPSHFYYCSAHSNYWTIVKYSLNQRVAGVVKLAH